MQLPEVPSVCFSGSASPARLQTAPEKTSLNRAQPTQAAVSFAASPDRSKIKTASKAAPRALKSITKAAFEDTQNDRETDTFVPSKKNQVKFIDKS